MASVLRVIDNPMPKPTSAKATTIPANPVADSAKARVTRPTLPNPSPALIAPPVPSLRTAIPVNATTTIAAAVPESSSSPVWNGLSPRTS